MMLVEDSPMCPPTRPSFALAPATLVAAALSLVTASAQAAGFTDIHPSGATTDNTYAYGVSADGNTAVGYSSIYSYLGSACFFDAAGLHDLGQGAGSYATGVSANGSIIVGTKSVGGLDQAFKFLGGTTTLLGDLGGGTSNALAISGNGQVIVGHSFDGTAEVAFKWTSGGMAAISTAPSGLYQDARATGVSYDGGVIVGWLTDSYSQIRAFRYTGTTLEVLPGQIGQGTFVFGVSANGNVIVGGLLDSVGYQYAFKYTEADGFVSLGFLYANQPTEAHAANANGSVIVGMGYAPGSGNQHAFKYQDGVMTDLGTLLGGTYSNATGVSADGTVIVGTSTVTGGYSHAFVYANDVMLDANEWMRSINGANSVLSMASSLSALPMEGAHHRPLMSYDSMGKQSQAWATGDFGASSRQSDSHVTTGEIGASTTFGNMVAGLAAGHGSQNQDLIYGGSAHVAGNYILGEIDARLPGTQGILSAVVLAGNWQANTYRGYTTGSGTQFSSGSTGLSSQSLRLRYDGPALRLMNRWEASPFASFTVMRTTADAYAETGGSFPAHFDAQAHTSQEARLGLTTKYILGTDTSLLLTGEWIHRFDATTATLTGNDVLHGALPFSAAGLPVTRDQARVGVDVDHKLNTDTLLNFSVHAASNGQSPDFSAALSIRRAF